MCVCVFVCVCVCVFAQTVIRDNHTQVYLRKNGLPQTQVYDRHRAVPLAPRGGSGLDWHVRFPSAGEWFVGVFSSDVLAFTIDVQVEACAQACSGKGRCVLRNQGGGLVIGSCECAFGFAGSGFA